MARGWKTRPPSAVVSSVTPAAPMWPELASQSGQELLGYTPLSLWTVPLRGTDVYPLEVAVGGKVRKTPQEVVSKLGSEHQKFQPGKLCAKGGLLWELAFDCWATVPSIIV